MNPLWFKWIACRFFMLMVSFLFKFRFIKALDSLDYRVEKLRKESISLTEKRDLLLMSMDILKHNELLSNLNECKFCLELIKCLVILA